MRANLNGHSLNVAQEASVHTVTTAVDLLPSQVITHCLINGAAYTVKLPPVVECAGMTFSVIIDKVDSAATVTVADFADSVSWSNFALKAADDNVVLYSTGTVWIELASTETA